MLTKNRSRTASQDSARQVPATSRAGRRIARLAVAAPVALVVSVMLHPNDTTDAADTLGRVAGEDRTRWILAHLLEPISWLLLAVVLLIATRVGKDAGRRLIQAGGYLGAAGAAAIALIVYSHGEFYLFMTEPGMDRAAMEQLYAHAQSAMPLVAPFAGAFQAAMLFLGIGLFKSRAVPRWAAVAFCAVPLAITPDDAAPWVAAIVIGIPLIAGLAGSARAIGAATREGATKS